LNKFDFDLFKYFFNKSWKIILDNESVESTEEDDAV